MKPVPTSTNQYQPINHLLKTCRSVIKNIWLMSVPILFLMPSSCNENHNLSSDVDASVTELRTSELCTQPPCHSPIVQYVSGEVYVVNGCSITVSYIKETCPKVINIRNMTYTFANSAACKSIKQTWNQYFLQGQTQLLNENMNILYKQLSEMIENKILGLNTSIEIMNFVETKCHTICAKEIKDDENPSFFEFRHEVCGTSCCIRTAKIVNGHKEAYTYYEGGACIPVTVNCQGDIHISNICEPACARL